MFARYSAGDRPAAPLNAESRSPDSLGRTTASRGRGTLVDDLLSARCRIRGVDGEMPVRERTEVCAICEEPKTLVPRDISDSGQRPVALGGQRFLWRLMCSRWEGVNDVNDGPLGRVRGRDMCSPC